MCPDGPCNEHSFCFAIHRRLGAAALPSRPSKVGQVLHNSQQPRLIHAFSPLAPEPEAAPAASEPISADASGSKLSRAAKRREKKEQEERERQQRIDDAEPEDGTTKREVNFHVHESMLEEACEVVWPDQGRLLPSSPPLTSRGLDGGCGLGWHAAALVAHYQAHCSRWRLVGAVLCASARAS